MTDTTVREALQETMTVKQLREALEFLDDDAPVFFVCDYGDYTHTQQALRLTEAMEVSSDDLHESGYSQSGIALADNAGEYEPDFERENGVEEMTVVVLK